MTATAQPSARATATAAAAATLPARKPGPAHAPKRPPLRVVDPNEKVKKAGRRRAHPRLLVAIGVLLGAGLLFGLVTAHVLLTQNQFRLQKVQRQAAQEQARYERLRAEVAELESPGRIVAAAQERLGMVPPASVKYLTPATGKHGKTAGAQPPGATTNAGAKGNDHDDADEQAMSDWAAVKRQLSRP